MHCLIAKQAAAEWSLCFLNRDCSQWLSDHNVPLYWTELIYGTLLSFFPFGSVMAKLAQVEQDLQEHLIQTQPEWIYQRLYMDSLAVLDDVWVGYGMNWEQKPDGLIHCVNAKDGQKQTTSSVDWKIHTHKTTEHTALLFWIFGYSVQDSFIWER